LNRFTNTFTCFILLIVWIPGIAQVRISGKVFDITEKSPLEAVSVLSSAGNGTVTNSEGRYSIVVNLKDSIWFSYLNKGTVHYPVSKIVNQQAFDIALHVTSTVLKDIRFSPKNYKLDSIQNRLDYAKAFDFHKPGVGSSINLAPGGGVGLDVNQFIQMFQFRRNRRMEAFQDRLVREEEDRFVDHRFSRSLIIRLTGLRGASLDSFIVRYRPTVEFTRYSTDYEFQAYIKQCFHNYQRYLQMKQELRLNDE
jgi:hypothetical protein